MANAPIDQNSRQGLFALSSVDGTTLVPLYANPTTHRLLVDSAAGTGTVTSVSVVTANGFAGTVATATTTPAITLTTTITGLLKGNGTAISAATAGTDYVTASSTNTFTNKTYDTAGAGNVFSINGTGITAVTGTGAVVLATNPTLSGLTFADATNVVINATTGTKFGTATTQKLAFYNATPIVQPTGDVITALQNLGLIASATIASSTNINTTTESTDTTCFPVFVTASGTQTLPAKTNTTLTYNSNTNDLGITKINGLTMTASTGTFTLTNAKTLSVTNTLTLSGTDGTTMTFPSTTATIARTDAAQTFTGTQTYSNAVIYTNNAIAASGNAATVPVTARLNTVTNNSAATLTITMTTASAVDGQMTIVRVLDFSAAAQTITWVNTENSTVSAPTTSNGSTTLPLTVGFMYNSATSKWRTIASA